MIVNLLGACFNRFFRRRLPASTKHEEDEPAAKKREAENDQRDAQNAHLRDRQNGILAPFPLSGHGKSCDQRESVWSPKQQSLPPSSP
jgi:hypothetical protein